MRNRLILGMIGLLLAVAAGLSLAQEPAGEKPVSSAEREKISITRDRMRALAADIEAYKGATKAYPKELAELVTANLRQSVPVDGWDNAFKYNQRAGDGFELASLGADKKAGGAGADADILWNEDGEVRELTAEEKAALAKKRDEQAAHGKKVLARARMTTAGKLLVEHRRNGADWPKKLVDLAPKGDTPGDKARARCFKDTWGNELAYKLLPGDNFAIVCLGADGKEGGTGNDGDFVVTENDVRIEMDAARATSSWRWDDASRDARRPGELASSVEDFRKKFDRLPKDLDELRVRKVRGEVPRDRFGNEFVYFTIDADEFYVVYLGRDNLPGGIGDAADAIAPAPDAAAGAGRDFDKGPKK